MLGLGVSFADKYEAGRLRVMVYESLDQGLYVNDPDRCTVFSRAGMDGVDFVDSVPKSPPGE